MADWQPPTRQLRDLPPMQRLLAAAERAPPGPWSRAALSEALRAELATLRHDLLAGAIDSVPPDAAVLARAAASLAQADAPALRRVINATGIVVHTNLGRAPLAAEAAEAAAEAGRAACMLEFDPETGRRGARGAAAEALLCRLTGADSALAVNNNAAALLLALSGLAAGHEVIVSRGELVEIGGGFRIPDIIRQGGARLVEVGSTNRTRLADYAAAITPNTHMLLHVHQSNFRIVGFTEAAGLDSLAGLARHAGLVLLADLGSGLLDSLPQGLAADEPTVRGCIAAGADLVAFSGDKLLGGPQAGLLVGRAAAIDPLRRHPLLRALRLDKMTLAALDATLRLHAGPDPLRVPVLRMLAQTEAELQARADRLSDMLAGIGAARVEPSIGHAGGGALPGTGIPSRAVSLAVPGLSADALARRLRAGRPAVVGYIREDRLLLDMLTVTDAEIEEIALSLRDVAG